MMMTIFAIDVTQNSHHLSACLQCATSCILVAVAIPPLNDFGCKQPWVWVASRTAYLFCPFSKQAGFRVILMVDPNLISNVYLLCFCSKRLSNCMLSQISGRGNKYIKWDVESGEFCLQKYLITWKLYKMKACCRLKWKHNF